MYSPEFKDWSIPFGRRFRAVRIWMVIEYFGVDGLRKYLQDGLDQANYLRDKVDGCDFLTQPVVTDLKLVCVRTKDEARCQEWIDEVFRLSGEGDEFLAMGSILEGKPMLRVALGGANTTIENVDQVFAAFIQAAKNIGLGGALSRSTTPTRG